MTAGGILGWALVALAAAGAAYQLIALACLARFFRSQPATPAAPEPVTILKPLYGAEPRLAENLGTFLDQHWPAPIQLLLATNTPDDPAIAAVDVLRAARPEAHITLSPGPRLPGANAKMGSCAAASARIAHDIVILSDSDMVVGRDYIARVTAALAQPGIGAVTCLYRGRGDAGFWSQAGAVMISYATLPAMVLGIATGLERPCMGSTIALRTDTLANIGGFAAFSAILADDYAIGAAIAARGLKVAVAPLLLTHAGAEASFAALWRQHLRWAATIRAINPAGHIGSGITHAVPLALLAALPHPAAGLGLTGLTLAIRLLIAAKVDRLASARTASWALIPFTDCLGLAVYVASLFARKIDWRGASLTMTAAGRIAANPKRDR